MNERAAAWRAARDSPRVDLQLIADMVEPGTRVLDVGCGDGALLAYLVDSSRSTRAASSSARPA